MFLHVDELKKVKTARGGPAAYQQLVGVRVSTLP